MKTKLITIAVIGLLMLSSATLLATVKAEPWPNLPLTPVQLTVVDGTTSYFISTLSGVPAGFDVTNGVYPGWCTERSKTMDRGVSHNVMLYSSMSPPPALSGINWVAINYILNHKQGLMMDVQYAIWHFTDGSSDGGAAAQAMVAAANANPTYDPTTGAILAVICLRQDDRGVQNTIIELRKPGLSPGFWKHNISVALGLSKGSFSSPHEGDPHLTLEDLQGWATEIGVTLQEAYYALNARGPGMDVVRLDMANAFNAAAGFGPYMD
jgi:hypothetical protein